VTVARPLLFVCISCVLACNITRMSRMDEFRLRSECAAQAEKVVAESRWKQIGAGVWVKTAQNHYNQELNRCFVHIHTMEASIGMDVVVEAYEDSILVNCTETPLGGKRSCSVPDTPKLNPEEADRRIKDYMEH